MRDFDGFNTLGTMLFHYFAHSFTCSKYVLHFAVLNTAIIEHLGYYYIVVRLCDH